MKAPSLLPELYHHQQQQQQQHQQQHFMSLSLFFLWKRDCGCGVGWCVFFELCSNNNNNNEKIYTHTHGGGGVGEYGEMRWCAALSFFHFISLCVCLSEDIFFSFFSFDVVVVVIH